MIFDNKKVEGWKYQDIGSDRNDGWCRLYWKKGNGFRGFEFASFLVASAMKSENPFEHENTNVELLLHGIAMFDGVRHLYFGSEESENIGYFYYPSLSDLSEIITALKRLELAYCDIDQIKA